MQTSDTESIDDTPVAASVLISNPLNTQTGWIKKIKAHIPLQDEFLSERAPKWVQNFEEKYATIYHNKKIKQAIGYIRII